MDEIIITHLKPNAQNIESWFAVLNNEIIGHIYMSLESDNRIKFMDAWVDSNHRRKGIYRKLWETRWAYVEENYKGHLVYAWCKEKSLPLLLEKGFDSGDVSTYVEKVVE